MPMQDKDMMLRCMAHPNQRGGWLAKCLDLDLVTEEPTLDEAKQDLKAMIESYVATVLDTEDHGCIPALLPRKGPWFDRLRFRLMSLGRGRGQCVVFRHELPLDPGIADNP